MTTTDVAPRTRLLGWALAASIASTAFDAAGQDATAAMREAGKHFDHGVALYGEADYPAALVEFKRAYALAPNTAVLYNIGEAQYQLEDYASALVTFTRYLAEAPPGSGHRSEVENDIDVLKGRVGHLAIVTVPPGADVSVDDQPAGKTPLDDRVLVSVGHRKVTAVCPGRAPVTRFVDVAADDSVSITLELPSLGPAAAPLPPAPGSAGSDRRAASGSGATLRAVGWVTTGLLATGAAGMGVLALRESAALSATRDTFPAPAATLQDESNRTRVYSIVADSLTVAAVAVGGITLLSTLTSHGAARGAETGARVRVGPTSVDLEGSF